MERSRLLVTDPALQALRQATVSLIMTFGKKIMKSLCVIFFIIFSPILAAKPFKLAISISDSQSNEFGANIIFNGNHALEYGPEITTAPDATYDLTKGSWTEGTSGKTITLIEAVRWADNSKKQAKASLTQMPSSGQKEFIEEMLSPKFKITKTAEAIQIKSQFLDYTASQAIKIDEDIKKNIFKYDVLNAFRKAMVLRKTPPFTQLEVTRILTEESFLPGFLYSEITTPTGSIKITIRYKISDLTPEEEEKITYSRTRR